MKWIESGELKVAKCTVFEMERIGEAHQLIQSGKSVGKIVLTTGASQPWPKDMAM